MLEGEVVSVHHPVVLIHCLFEFLVVGMFLLKVLPVVPKNRHVLHWTMEHVIPQGFKGLDLGGIDCKLFLDFFGLGVLLEQLLDFSLGLVVGLEELGVNKEKFSVFGHGGSDLCGSPIPY